jgi:hypothetical protein
MLHLQIMDMRSGEHITMAGAIMAAHADKPS